MKKIVSVLAFTTYLLSASPAFAAAVDLCDESSDFGKLCGLTSGNFGKVVGGFVTLLFVIAVVVALIFLVWGGLRWIFSGGDKSAVESARNTIVAAIVGLVIVFLAYFILNLVLTFFLGTGLNELKIPTIGL
ncbi:MAG: hypothetical protein A3H50_00550 [Candidatus Levybacteria bacterium RIFCSPLOWO2_02_FULL_37_10]|nr:MAG: hypothetical protein A2860_02185 [Candidatus Levybacteria bacterium RIFCSPHIGHO2_01_FULL_37_33]OGH44173.1 MAG: hypothetical protein A3H50_00550 [Candidatus Levybacteria bacterium RIFCSPLOWO2_02_FULL_37_10]